MQRVLQFFMGWRWTPWRAVFVALMVWVILLIVFAPWQICKPFLSAACISHAWDFVGAAVWLTGLKEWQTLIAGLMALGAAIIAAAYLKQQIQQTEKHEREKWRRQLDAERAGLPDTLSYFVDYLEKSSAILHELRLACKKNVLPRSTEVPVFPIIPIDVAGSFRRMVELGNEEIAAKFKILLSENQVFSTRCRSLQEPGASSQNIDTYIANAVRLHAIAMQLFPYARFDTDEVPTKQMVAGHYFTSFSILSFDEHTFPGAYEKIEKMVKRDLDIDKED